MGSKTIIAHLHRIRRALEHLSIFTDVQKSLICAVFLLVLAISAGFWTSFVMYTIACTLSYAFACHIGGNSDEVTGSWEQRLYGDRTRTMLFMQSLQNQLFNFLYGGKRKQIVPAPCVLTSSGVPGHVVNSDSNIKRNDMVNLVAKTNASDVDKYSDYQKLHSQFHDVDRVRRKTDVSEMNLQAEIQQISALVLKDFVLSWYQQVSFGNYGAENAQKIIDHITSTAYARIAAIDRHAVINKCIELYMCHLQEFQEALKTYNKQPRYRRRGSNPKAENEFLKVKSIEELYEKNLQFHVALIGEENEGEYLRAIVDVLLQRLLSADLYNCMTFKDMFAEVLICNVVSPLLELLCDPDFLHEKTIQILTDDGDDISEQLLAMKAKLTVYKDDNEGASLSSLRESSNSQTAVEENKTPNKDNEILNTPGKDVGKNEEIVKKEQKISEKSKLVEDKNISSKVQEKKIQVTPSKSVGHDSESESEPKKDYSPDNYLKFSVHGHGNADALMQPSASGCAENQEFVFFTDALAEHFKIAPARTDQNVPPKETNLGDDFGRVSDPSLTGPIEKAPEESSFKTLPVIQLQPSTPVTKALDVPNIPDKTTASSSAKSLPKFSSLPRDLDKMPQHNDANSKNAKNKFRRLSLNSLPSDEEDHLGLSPDRRRSLTEEKKMSNTGSANETGSDTSSYAQIDMFEVYQDPGTGQLRVRQRSRLETSPSKMLAPVTEGVATDPAKLDPNVSDYSTRSYRNSSNASDYLVISSENSSPFNSSSGNIVGSSDSKDAGSLRTSTGDKSAISIEDKSVDTLTSVRLKLEDSLTNASNRINTSETSHKTMQMQNSSHVIGTATNNAPSVPFQIGGSEADKNFSPKRIPSISSSPSLIAQSKVVQDFSSPSFPSPSSSPGRASLSDENCSPKRLLSVSSSPGDISQSHELPVNQGRIGQMLRRNSASQNSLPDPSSSPGSVEGMWPLYGDQFSRGSSPDPVFPVETGSRTETWMPLLYTSLHIPRTEFIQERGHGSFVVYEVEYLAHYRPEGSQEPELVPRNVKRRFKEFVILQERFEENPKLKGYLKGIKAPSKWFSLPFGKFDKDGIENRRKLLDKYLQSVLEREPLLYSGELREFLAYDGDASLAFVKKATDIPVSWIDKVFNKTKSSMSGVIEKIDQTLTSKPPLTLEEASPAVVQKQSKAKRIVDVEKLPSEDVDALRVQFAVTSEKQKVELGLDRHLLTQLFLSPDSFGVEMTESQNFSDEDFQDAYDGDEDDEVDVILADQSVENNLLRQNTLSHTILDLACQTTNDQEIALCQEKMLESFQIMIGTFFEKWLRNEIADITSTESITKYLHLFREVMWPVRPFEELPKTEEDKQKTKQLARDCLKEFFPALIALLAGEDNFNNCVEQVLNSVQHPKINRHFFLCLIDLLIEEFLPEISVKAVQQQILITRGKH